MKRMIDGIINFSVTKGRLGIANDTSISVDFHFPLGYWPISLNSKPFSILPGRIMFGDDQSNISNICFDSTQDPKFSRVIFASGAVNASNYEYNYISYSFNFADKARRDAFIAQLFGPGATNDASEFVCPISMLLVAFDGASDY